MSNRTSLASVSSFKSTVGSPNNVSRQSSRSLRPLVNERNSHLEEFDDSPIFFVEIPPDTLKCRLCEAVFRTPVVLTCGHTVCKSCSYQYSNCGICGAEMRMVVENLSLQEQIGQLEVYCDFGIKENTQDPNGCPDIIQLLDRKGHLEECDYAPVHCPNSPNCEALIRRDLEEHIKKCTQKKCLNFSKGCPRVGDKDVITEHEENCIFALMGDSLTQAIENKLVERDEIVINPFIRRFDERLNSISLEIQQLTTSGQAAVRLSDDVQELRNDINLLSNQLSELTARFNSGALGNYEPQKIFKVKGTFVGHQGQVWCLAVAGDILFSGAGDAEIKCWDTAQNYRCQKTFEGHTQPILAMATQNSQLYSTGLDCSIHIWNVSNLSSVHKVEKAHDKAVCSIAANPNYLFTGSLNVIKVWKIQESDSNQAKAPIEYLRSLTDVSNYVRSLHVNSGCLYAGSTKLITIWNIESFKIIRQINIPGVIYSLCVIKDYVLAGTDEKLIHIWNNDSSMDVACRLRGHTGTILGLTALSTGENIKVFSASADRSLRVWSMENMLCTQILDRHQGNVTSLAVSRGRVFSGSVDQTVKVWV